MLTLKITLRVSQSTNTKFFSLPTYKFKHFSIQAKTDKHFHFHFKPFFFKHTHTHKNNPEQPLIE